MLLILGVLHCFLHDHCRLISVSCREVVKCTQLIWLSSLVTLGDHEQHCFVEPAFTVSQEKAAADGLGILRSSTAAETSGERGCDPDASDYGGSFLRSVSDGLGTSTLTISRHELPIWRHCGS